MSSDSSLPTVPSSASNSLEASLNSQVRFKSAEGHLLLFLPPEPQTQDTPSGPIWSELRQQINQRLNAGERFWQAQTEVHLVAGDRLLDARQLQEIDEALATADLQLKRVYTGRRQTAVVAATAGYSVEQQSSVPTLNQNPAPLTLAEPLYLQMTVRSGVDIRHPGTVILLGDLNPGGAIVAEGDILVWGRLRGVVHAGVSGNTKSIIAALQMEPTLIRIADQVARGPEQAPVQFQAEVAYITPQGIRISRVADFAKMKR